MSVKRPPWSVTPNVPLQRKKDTLYAARLERLRTAKEKNDAKKAANAKPAQKGVIPLIVAGIVALALLIGGGIAALVATGNSPQALGCVENTINGNPAAVGTLVAGLSTNVEQDAENAITALGPSLAKCLLLDLWNDGSADLAAKAALKQTNIPVAPAAQLKANAIFLTIKHGWATPAGPLPSTSGGSTGGTTGH